MTIGKYEIYYEVFHEPSFWEFGVGIYWSFPIEAIWIMFGPFSMTLNCDKNE